MELVYPCELTSKFFSRNFAVTVRVLFMFNISSRMMMFLMSWQSDDTYDTVQLQITHIILYNTKCHMVHYNKKWHIVHYNTKWHMLRCTKTTVITEDTKSSLCRRPDWSESTQDVSNKERYKNDELMGINPWKEKHEANKQQSGVEMWYMCEWSLFSSYGSITEYITIY